MRESTVLPNDGVTHEEPGPSPVYEGDDFTNTPAVVGLVAFAETLGVSLRMSEDANAFAVEWILNHGKPGAGEVVLRRAIAEADKAGKPLILDAHEGNPKLIDYYTKLGFKPWQGELREFGGEWTHGMRREPMVHGSVPLRVDFHGAPPIEGPAARGQHHGASDFQAWFGTSQVRDDQGQPLVVYHGTLADFTTPRMNGSGLFFVTPDKASVAEFVDGRPGVRVMSLYASIKNVFDSTDKASIDALIAVGKKRGWIRGDVATLTYDSGQMQMNLELLRGGDHVAIESREVVAAAKAMGHDGIKLIERGMTNFAVFAPEQIRIADSSEPGFWPGDRRAAAEVAKGFLATVDRKVAPHA